MMKEARADSREIDRLLNWATLAKALFEIERDPSVKDQAWFDFEAKAKRLLAALKSPSV